MSRNSIFTPLTSGLVLVLSLICQPIHAGRADTSSEESSQPANHYLLKRESGDQLLLDFDSADSLKNLTLPKDFSVKIENNAGVISGPMHGTIQTVQVSSGSTLWDISNFLYLATDVQNKSTNEVTIICRVQDPDYAGWHHYAESVARLGAADKTTLLVFLKRKNPPADELKSIFPGMDALPDGYMPHWSGLDPARVAKVIFQIQSTGSNVLLGIGNLRAADTCDPKPLTQPGYFPFIDFYGQFSHADWPTKVHSITDFATQRQAEAAAIKADPRPLSWDKYGGYKDGPQLAASGNFRVEKYAAKWWLVDPDGHLFWSHGVTGVGIGAATPIHGRENFFATTSILNEGNPESINCYLANLKLKYGTNAINVAAELAHKRLANWGLNTMACWTDPLTSSLNKTPYTEIVNVGGAKLAPSLKLSDPFDEAFSRNVRTAFESKCHTTARDPWCIGYFIGNELEWRGGPDMINEILTAPAKQAGKLALINLLQQRHASLADLNAAWHTSYATWNDLLSSTNKVDAALAVNDFTAFNELLARSYYETCATELKRAAPGKLNLGSRFHTVNPIAVRAAARYCDVVSFNKYATSIRDLRLPDNLDRPIIIGEFHFPAWDRSFAANSGTGPLCEAQRADSYWYYVTGGLDNPLVVGTHWFQYLDQPLTGRTDGENFPIGFVDVTDTPYDELTKNTRELGEGMYLRRLGIVPARPDNQNHVEIKQVLKSF